MATSYHQIGSLPFEDPGYSRSTTHAPLPGQSYHSRFQYQAHPLAQAQTASQYHDSYFPATLSSTQGGSGRPINHNNSSIDDILYHPNDFDHTPLVAPGTPTVGVYSRDGLWDDEDEAREVQSSNGLSSSTASSSRNTSIANTSYKSRSRSNTVNASSNAEEKGRGAWNWRRPSMAHGHTHRPVVAMEEVDKPSKGLEKKKSKGLLRGKGRRGELSVTVASEEDESFEAPPPLPPTPASYFTDSPASFSSSTFSPVNYPSPMLDTPTSMSTPALISTSTSTATSTNASKPSKATSSWKRGMQKIFKSKSSAALRDAATKESTVPPPLPSLPPPSKHGLGKPFSSSTPPLGESKRVNVNVPGYLSTPPSATIESFVLSEPPSLPHDPFASSLNLSSNQPLPSPAFSKPRPSLRHNSPSLRDLKNLLPINTKPKLSKAKSLANLQHQQFDGPKSAPLERTDYFPPTSKLAKRMSSLVGLNIFAASAPENGHGGEALEAPPSRASLALPIESPPLLPPHPPFASASRSSSLPSITTDSEGSSSEDSSRISMPPNAPLPPVPSSGSSPSLTTPIQRSGSGAVLLPRSRSTSMSFKSPPTSSSFFDLYEQLGIWPNAEKEKEKGQGKEQESSAGKIEVEAAPEKQLAIREVEEKDSSPEDKENAPPPVPDVIETDHLVGEGEEVYHEADETQATSGSHVGAQIPTSESMESTASWNIAINSFPEAPADDVLDFGLPYVADDEGIESISDPVQKASDNSDTLSIMAVAASSRDSAHNTTMNDSISTDNRASGSTVTQATSVGMEYLNSSFSSKGRGRGSGSNDSSREGSPDRRRSSQPEEDEQESDDSSSNEDDVPLSKLHPEAAAAQAQRREARRAARAIKKSQVTSQGMNQVLNMSRAKSAKTHGRNPGGESNWDGEGGVPADILFRRLEVVFKRRADREAAALATASHGESRRSHEHTLLLAPQGLRAHRSMREQLPAPLEQNLRRAQSQSHVHVGPPSAGWHHGDAPPLPPIQTAIPPRSSPTLAVYPHHVQSPSSAVSPTDMSFGRIPSAKRVDPAFAAAMQSHSHTHGHGHAHIESAYMDRSRQNSVATSVSSRMPHVPSGSRAPSRQDDRSHPSSGAVTRSNTSATQASTTSRHRARAASNAAPPGSHREESAALHARAITEPLPHLSTVAPASTPVAKASTSVPAFVSALNGKKIMLEITPSTTAREVLVSTYHKGELVDATVGMSWVLCEVFAEMGCERQVREYEPLLPIVKGWDQTAKYNCFVFKQSNRGMPTWARAVPTTPPMIGSWVHYETKKGKWSKKWLETRGGQVFLAKNEKNKDEVHLNILFFDIYAVTRPYDSPKPSTFMMKRVEPASTFEDPADYAHTFSCEDGQAFKLMGAIYDAKSYTSSQTYPSMIASQLPTSATTSSGSQSGSLGRRPTAAHPHHRAELRAPSHGQGPVHQPLVSLSSEDDRNKGAFTGKGLLKI